MTTVLVYVRTDCRVHEKTHYEEKDGRQKGRSHMAFSVLIPYETADAGFVPLAVANRISQPLGDTVHQRGCEHAAATETRPD